MTNFHVITKDKFANKSWERPRDYLRTAKDMICKLNTVELPRAMMSMPIALFPTDGEYSFVAVQGLRPGTNSFLHNDGVWQGDYIPALYRGYPFSLMHNESKGEPTFCFDVDSGLMIDDGTGEPFFSEGLEPSESVKEIIEFLVKLDNTKKVSIQICKSLSEHDLIKPWELTFELENKLAQVDGLFCIDETAFNELSNESYSKLRIAGAIPAIYCQLLSMQRISYLIEFLQDKSKTDALQQGCALSFDGGDTDGNISFENL